MGIINLTSQLTDTAIYLSLAPIAMGGALAYFETFLCGENELRQRIDLVKKRLTENVAQNYSELFNTAISLDIEKIPNLSSDHVVELFRILSIVQRVDCLERRVRLLYWSLMASTVLGIIGFLSALLWNESRFMVGFISASLILFQIVAVLLIRHYEDQVRQHEQTA